MSLYVGSSIRRDIVNSARVCALVGALALGLVGSPVTALADDTVTNDLFEANNHPQFPSVILGEASRTVVEMEAAHATPAKRSFSTEAQLYRLRASLKVLGDAPTRARALELWARAQRSAAPLPLNVGATDEMAAENFRQILVNFEAMRKQIEAREYGNFDFFVTSMKLNLANHERLDLAGAQSARGRALVAEAEQLATVLGPKAKQYEQAIRKLNLDPTYRRLTAEQDDLSAKATALATEIGLADVAYETACVRTDAPARRLCLLDKQQHALSAKITAIEKHYGL